MARRKIKIKLILMDILLKTVIASALITSTYCFDDCLDDECSSEKEMEDFKRLGLASNYLASNVYQKLTAVPDNIFFSPFTLSTVLTMFYMGARGEAAQELRKFLGFHQSMPDDSTVFRAFQRYTADVIEKLDPQSYTVKLASAVIVDDSFHLKPEYKNKVEKIFEAYVVNANLTLEAGTITEKLNSWVRKKSRGIIKTLVDSIDPATTLMLVSAAYFKGSWRIQFDPFDTKYHVFFNNGRRVEKRDVLMMHIAQTYRYYEDEEFSAIELMYEGKNMSMIIFLPKDIGGLREMEETLTPAKISFVRRYMYYTKVHLTLPKFKLAFNRDLSSELQELGVQKVFCGDADLSGMTETVSTPATIKHKAMIEVNEKGSVAGAVSSVIMTKMIPLSDSVPEFRADHPFLFAIVDTRSGLILFMGRINKL